MENKLSLFSLSTPRVIGLLLHYFVGYLYIYRLIASRITLLLNPFATSLPPTFQIGIYAITVFGVIILIWPSFIHSLRTFKKHIKKHLKLILKLTIVLLIVNVTLSVLVSIITQTNGSANQEEINKASTTIPVITFFATCFIAPFVEEGVFRSGVFTCLRKKSNFLVSALISGILFGSIHCISSLLSGDMLDLSYLLVYGALGIILAYSYEQSDSIVVSFGVHAANNFFAWLAIFLL